MRLQRLGKPPLTIRLPTLSAPYPVDVLFYGVVSAQTEKVVEFSLEQEKAEEMIREFFVEQEEAGTPAGLSALTS